MKTVKILFNSPESSISVINNNPELDNSKNDEKVFRADPADTIVGNPDSLNQEKGSKKESKIVNGNLLSNLMSNKNLLFGIFFLILFIFLLPKFFGIFYKSPDENYVKNQKVETKDNVLPDKSSTISSQETNSSKNLSLEPDNGLSAKKINDLIYDASLKLGKSLSSSSPLSSFQIGIFKNEFNYSINKTIKSYDVAVDNNQIESSYKTILDKKLEIAQNIKKNLTEYSESPDELLSVIQINFDEMNQLQKEYENLGGK